MLTILKSLEGGLSVIVDIRDGCWINLVDPSHDEIKTLSERLSVPHDFLTAPLDPDERARTEKEDEIILIILRIPHHQGETSDIPYTTIPLGIILTANQIITVCKIKNPVIDGFLNGTRKGISTAKKYRFVLQILYRNASEYLKCLNAIDAAVEILEDKLQVSQRNKELLDILKYQKSLVYFTTALKSNELIVQRLQRSKLFHMYPEDEDLLEDVLIEVQQAIEMVNISSNILSQMMDAFASIISNNLNVVMKILAIVTIVLSLPTLVASVLGMNVDMPFTTSHHAFWGAMIVSFGLSALVVVYFWYKKWF